MQNDTIERMLKGYFQNKRYNLSFMDKYVSMKPVNKGSELILSKANEPNGFLEYSQTLNNGTATLSFRMVKDDDGDWLLGIDLFFPNNDTPFMPIQMPTGDYKNKHGFIICHLTKTE